MAVILSFNQNISIQSNHLLQVRSLGDVLELWGHLVMIQASPAPKLFKKSHLTIELHVMKDIVR